MTTQTKKSHRSWSEIKTGRRANLSDNERVESDTRASPSRCWPVSPQP